LATNNVLGFQVYKLRRALFRLCPWQKRMFLEIEIIQLSKAFKTKPKHFEVEDASDI
jgi:hypothetical protein